MARRFRYKDAHDAKHIVGPPAQGKPRCSHKQRHAKRLGDALRSHEEAAGWCEQNGWVMRVHNGGHHWIFEQQGIIVEWWPSSAKLVRDKAWADGIHTHGWEQVVKILEAWQG